MKSLTTFISPLEIGGLKGRRIDVSSTKPTPGRAAQRNILLLYGHHALIERWFGLIENLQPYGNVTMPDLPGFGGMDSFYHAHKKPTVDEYADYLATFVKENYDAERFTIIGISFGFVIATRMLQRHPELVGRVELLISLVGFMHREDFLFKPRTRKAFALGTKFFSTPPVATIIRYGFMNRLMIQAIYKFLPNGKKRFLELDDTDLADRMMSFETKIWQANDVRTHWATTNAFLRLDNCQSRINLPVWHIGSRHDHYFDNAHVKAHMLAVFSSYELVEMDSLAHTPHVVATTEEVGVMLPPKIRQLLAVPTSVVY